jgi:hypothetical protein
LTLRCLLLRLAPYSQMQAQARAGAATKALSYLDDPGTPARRCLAFPAGHSPGLERFRQCLGVHPVLPTPYGLSQGPLGP